MGRGQGSKNKQETALKNTIGFENRSTGVVVKLNKAVTLLEQTGEEAAHDLKQAEPGTKWAYEALAASESYKEAADIIEKHIELNDEKNIDPEYIMDDLKSRKAIYQKEVSESDDEKTKSVAVQKVKDFDYAIDLVEESALGCNFIT